MAGKVSPKLESSLGSKGKSEKNINSEREQAIALATSRKMRSNLSKEMDKKVLDGTYDNDTWANIDKLDSRSKAYRNEEEDRDERKKDRQYDRDMGAYRMQQGDQQRERNTTANEGIREAGVQRQFQGEQAGRDRAIEMMRMDAQAADNARQRSNSVKLAHLGLAGRSSDSQSSSSAARMASAEADKDRATQMSMLSMQLGNDRYKTFMGASQANPAQGRYWG